MPLSLCDRTMYSAAGPLIDPACLGLLDTFK
jgi:hypothetical protein